MESYYKVSKRVRTYITLRIMYYLCTQGKVIGIQVTRKPLISSFGAILAERPNNQMTFEKVRAILGNFILNNYF
jgi:hypothetical protein